MTSYQKKLNLLVDQIFDEISYYGWTLSNVADRAKLCYSTVIRLNNRMTVSPHLRTVFALAKAVGFDIQLIKTETKRKRA